nr:MAG TPA: hypothetical protein [Caudoviricetes sp.]
MNFKIRFPCKGDLKKNFSLVQKKSQELYKTVKEVFPYNPKLEITAKSVKIEVDYNDNIFLGDRIEKELFFKDADK